jgi:hypothetical protein
MGGRSPVLPFHKKCFVLKMVDLQWKDVEGVWKGVEGTWRGRRVVPSTHNEMEFRQKDSIVEGGRRFFISS